MTTLPKILITGGAGYIGSHAVKLFLSRGYEVVVFDNLSRGYRAAIDILHQNGPLTFVQGDLRQPDDLRKLFAEHPGIDAVLHFAALCLVNESVEQPGLYFYNNTLGTLNLLEAMRAEAISTLIFSSTCAVYGNTQYLPVDEQHPTEPASPYGESKLLTERMIRWYGSIYGLRYAILRYFNVCGAASDGTIGDSKKPSQLMLQNAVRGALGIEPFSLTCPTVATPDKTPIRDYIDVEDLVVAHLAAYTYLHQGGSSDTFNLGNGTGYSVKQIIAKVEAVFQTQITTANATPRKGEAAQIYANPDKARRTLGFTTHKSLEDSILSLKKWYEGHPHGYQP